MLPLVDRSKLYDLVSICQKLLPNAEEVLTVGAGAGPYPLINSNCEVGLLTMKEKSFAEHSIFFKFISQGIFNLSIRQDKSVISETHVARVTPDNESCVLIKVPNTETKCALLANLFLSEGKSGQVLRVHCKHRIGQDNFISSVRGTLAAHYTDKTVGQR